MKKKIFRKSDKNCNCQRNRTCPLSENCQYEDVVYQAEVLCNGQDSGQGDLYVGLASGLVKKRISNHFSTFGNESKRNQCELSKFIWKLKDRGINNFEVKWKILAQENLYSTANRKCQLCSREKVEIQRAIKRAGNKCINKREEMFRRCIHRFKYYLGYLDGPRKEKPGISKNPISQANENPELVPEQATERSMDNGRPTGKTRSGLDFRQLEPRNEGVG